MKKTIALMTLAAVLAAPMAAQAHRAWMVPAYTNMSGDDAWVSFDAGMSNGVFIPDHAAMRLDNLTIIGPDGAAAQAENLTQSRYRSTFDLHLTRPGTYKVANVSSGFMASYMLDGERKRWRGPAADFPAAIPAGATEVVPTRNNNRIETFVTLGAPNETALTPTGQGLEMVPVTHPTDLVVGEPATFKLVMNGAPAADLEVTVARDGLRYRDNPEEQTTKTGADGAFTITWPEAGKYWMNASVRTAAQGETPASNASYVGVVEVLP